MRRASVLIAAAAHLRPLHQGHLSSLCGLYSLLNAVQLAAWPQRQLTQTELKTLFVYGVEHLDGADILTSVHSDGIHEEPWLRMFAVILRRSNQLPGIRFGRHFFLHRLENLTGRKALSAIKHQLRLGRPVIAMLWGGYDHATVIVGYDRARLILFDSAGFQWIMQSSVGLHHASSTKRHQITRQTVVALSATTLDQSRRIKSSMFLPGR